MYRNFRYGGVGMHGAFIRGPKQYSENKAGPLIIENINRMGYRNHAAHHTDVFVINVNDEDLVLRRGQEFTIELQCNRNFDVDTDLLEISMELGEEGDYKIGTLINIPLGVDLDPLHWGGAIRDVKDDSVVVEIMSSCESIIGEWTLKAVARQPWDPTFDPPAAEQDVIMLFNPWCPYDDVYMADEAEINEYVMNENGILWKGSHDKMTPAKWLYGQFEEVSLRAAMMILGLSTTAKSYMKSAAIVTRVLTQMVNANDNDGGILVGRWSGKYEGGTRPTGWNGSEPILAEWIKNRRSVKYAQCWVFCGVLTTICRTLGIPARSITNYTSAHDTDGSLTIDFHFDARTYQFMKKESPDSTWNFHCWNEAYMKRGDLPPKYHGWQAIDSTPQELSGSAMRCGPASVKAIKEGNILQEFDVPFVFSEVNGDVVYWLLNDDGSREFFSNDAERVGKNISTKMVGTDERNDVTKEYKEADDSYKERIAFLSALRYSKPKDLANMASGLFDTNISFEVQAPETGDVKAVLTVRNDSTEERNCNFSVTVLHSNDIGEHRGDVKHERGNYQCRPTRPRRGP
ncbi:coagulation factor XIII A chain-like [Lineus longissimus]|uniref:coagulation factor XIII A chain-like n=1 Tax=Lineus longissimus TaxID=88925 RepID=UPI00315C7E1D